MRAEVGSRVLNDMNEVKAFVGHSFTEDDAGVVSAFLTYFEQVSGLYPAFTWQHATASEPVDLRDKVLSVIEGKNTFIGICTRKERVAGDADFHNAAFSSRNLCIPREKLAWKTSDWVIQEIGLAIGRGMAVILLVEDGVRSPGGLQGNIEYLPFKRAAPEASFGKLLEMIRALSPPTGAGVGSSPDPTASDAAVPEQRPDASTNAESAEPTPEWTRVDYDRAHFMRLIMDDESGASEISAAYLRSAQASDSEVRGLWEAQIEWTKVLLDKGGSLPRLRQLTNEFPKNAEVRGYLAYALAKYGEQLEAADCHDAAAALAPDALSAVSYLCSAAIERARGGKAELGMSTLERAKELGLDTPEARSKILKAVQDIAELQKDSYLKLDALEGSLDLSPEDVNLRFTVAYEHSQIGNDDLSLKHYLKIPHPERTSMTWNNLGVAFQEFGMPGKSIDCYRQAATLGESLAMSNLGYKFMESGFFDEADQEFKRALAVEGFHKNVGQGVSALKSAPEREDEKEGEMLLAAAGKAAFYRALGKAVVSKEIALSGTWAGPTGDLTVTLSNGKFTARGEYEVKNALSGISSTAPAPSRYIIEYKGKVTGGRIQGSVTRTPENQPRLTSILGSSDNSSDFLMHVSIDGKVIEAAENPRSRKPTFYQLIARS